MDRAAVAAWIALSVSSSACAPEARFDPAPFVGAWRGRWTDDAGRRGLIDLEVAEHGGELVFAYGLRGAPLLGRRAARERLRARILGGSAVLAGRDSELFGAIDGSLSADGSLVVECEDVRDADMRGSGCENAERK